MPSFATVSIADWSACALPLASIARSGPRPREVAREREVVRPEDRARAEARRHLGARGVRLDRDNVRPAADEDLRDEQSDDALSKDQNGVACVWRCV